MEQIGDVVETTLPWKDQPGLTVAYDMGEPSITERLADKRTEQVIVETVDFGEGGFKIDVLLSEKPDTNRFCYQIEGAENYDFFYQPPLTAEEIAEGASRPPEIEGSYAVYHKTLKNHEIGKENYATGKVMHIPRPQVWEIGNEEKTKQWADLSYTDGQLCVTTPQDFIDNADYKNGVRIDPTFGYMTIGASDSGTFSQNGIRAVLGQPIQGSGSLVSISSYISTVSGSGNYKGVIFASSTKTLLTNGISGAGAIPTSYAWATTTYSTQPTLSSAETYYAGIIHNATFGVTFKIDTAVANTFAFDSTNDYTTPTDPTDATAGNNVQYSQYATYSVATRTIETFALAESPRSITFFASTSDPGVGITAIGVVLDTNMSFTNPSTSTVTYVAPYINPKAIEARPLSPATPYFYRLFVEDFNGRMFGELESATTSNEYNIRINNGTTRINNGTIDL